MKVRTRFAPSPTGFLHVGGVRTALFAWLVARQAGGQFILRIEDTDKAREVAGSEQHIQDCLEWLGLNWDEGPYRQSERLDTYREWAQRLVDKGRAYADSHTPEQLGKLRAEAKAAKKPFLFREHRPANPPKWDGGQPLRFLSQPQEYSWRDEVMGKLSAGPEAIDDFIILKSDGYPTYNFAHIVDDNLMEVSHVIRSQEFLPSVPKFLNLYDALEIERPKLATLPYVLGPDGKKKLSKRDGAKDILDYKKEGYLPAALINFLATLGWNDGTEQEIFSIDELTKKFDLSRVHKSGARFDEKRLEWMNGHYLRQLAPAKLAKAAEEFWPADAAKVDDDYKQAVLAVVQERLKYLSELPELTELFFKEPAGPAVTELYEQPVDKQLTTLSKNQLSEFLKAVIDELRGSDFSKDDISRRMNELLARLKTKPGILFAAVRIAVTGAAASPELFGTLAVLGKDKSLTRLQKALTGLEKQA